jgi:hypothetical protein
VWTDGNGGIRTCCYQFENLDAEWGQLDCVAHHACRFQQRGIRWLEGILLGSPIHHNDISSMDANDVAQGKLLMQTEINVTCY